MKSDKKKKRNGFILLLVVANLTHFGANPDTPVIGVLSLQLVLARIPTLLCFPLTSSLSILIGIDIQMLDVDQENILFEIISENVYLRARQIWGMSCCYDMMRQVINKNVNATSVLQLCLFLISNAMKLLCNLLLDKCMRSPL